MVAQRQLAAARQLASLLSGGNDSVAAAAPADVGADGSAAEYLTAVRASLEADVAYLKEVCFSLLGANVAVHALTQTTAEKRVPLLAVR